MGRARSVEVKGNLIRIEFEPGCATAELRRHGLRRPNDDTVTQLPEVIRQRPHLGQILFNQTDVNLALLTGQRVTLRFVLFWLRKEFSPVGLLIQLNRRCWLPRLPGYSELAKIKPLRCDVTRPLQALEYLMRRLSTAARLSFTDRFEACPVTLGQALSEARKP